MSPFTRVTLNTTKLTRIKFLSQEIHECIPKNSRTSPSFPLICVKNAENGKRVTFDTATQLLEAINSMLEEAGRPRITLDDLGLTLY